MVKPTFKDLPFQRYNMSLETQLDNLDNNVGDSEPGTYKKCFTRVMEVMNELSAMFEKDWSKCLPTLTVQSTEHESMDEECKVNELMDEKSPSYNLRWTVLPVPSGDDTLADEDPTYNLGWDMGPPAAPPVVDITINNEGPLYDLGWRATTLIIDAAVEDEEGLSYDLWWSQSANSPTIRDVTSTAKVINQDDDVIDLTCDDIAPHIDVINWTDNDPSETKLMHHINRLMKAIGNIFDDHMPAIVENEVHGSNRLRLIENRQLLRWFSDTRN
ncbi:hypothetical protein EDD22DRAFT_850616 [Suillus occidentalis]|nr:hypothetical protein EDD22DRAFT_850616 [Suillus occidentalis]